jgi:ABC-type spermidine/putrescine transport system permease subunit II
VSLTSRFFTWGLNSLRVAVLASVLAVVLATVVAYAIRLAPGVVTRAGSRVLILGYAVPGTVLAVGVLLPLGAVDNWLATAVRAATGYYPGLLPTGTIFVSPVPRTLLRVAWNGIEPAFARITPAMDAAARSLGVGAWGTLRRVHAPLLARSGAAALLLVFVDVMKELPATLILRPFNFDTLATQTYLLAKDERLAEAALPGWPSWPLVIPIFVLARIGQTSCQNPEANWRAAPIIAPWAAAFRLREASASSEQVDVLSPSWNQNWQRGARTIAWFACWAYSAFGVVAPLPSTTCAKPSDVGGSPVIMPLNVYITSN